VNQLSPMSRRADAGTLGGPVGVWSSRDLARWGSVVSVAGVGCFVAWYLAAGDTSYNKQVGPIDLAMVGLLVAAAANIGFLLVGRRAIGVRRRMLVGEAAPVLARSVAPVAGTIVPLQTSLVGAPGLRHFHRADCVLAHGRDWPAVTRSEHEAAGRTACGVCRP